MPLIPDTVFQNKLSTLPLATYRAGETVLTAASTTGRLLILRQGAVAVVKDGVAIAKVTEPGAVFGELSVLLGQPHTADVHNGRPSRCHRRHLANPQGGEYAASPVAATRGMGM